MNIGDLVRVVSKNTDLYGEIGIITKRLNNFFIHAMVGKNYDKYFIKTF